MRLELLLGAIAIAALAFWVIRSRTAAPPVRRPCPTPPITQRDARDSSPTAPPQSLAGSPAAAAPVVPTGAMSAEDGQMASLFAQRLALHSPIASADIAAIETLSARYPAESGLRDLLVSALLTTAAQDRQARHYDAAAAGLRKAADLRPADPAPRLALASLFLEAADWSSAEGAARDALQIQPRNPDALESLAFALFRQDRNREALDALRRPSTSVPARPRALSWRASRRGLRTSAA